LPADWSRETTLLFLRAVDPAFATALNAYVERHQLAALSSRDFCCQTVSRSTKKHLFGLLKDGREVRVVLVIASGLVLVATRDGNSSVGVVHARLRDLEVRDYAPTRVDDHGIELHGFRSPEGQGGTLFVGLGRGGAGDEVARQLRSTARVPG
jgi:hypothetical protein